jgi:hypothetical protein
MTSTNDNEETTFSYRKALFSFALRWHKASHGMPRVRSREALDAWRDEHRRDVLYTRSLVYFKRETPRVALFENMAAVGEIVEALRAMSSHSAALFVVAQLVDTMRYIIRTELVVRGELAIVRFLEEFPKRLVENIEAAEKRLLRASIESAPADTKAMHAMIADQYVASLRADLSAALEEPVRFQVRCAAAIDDAELPVEDRLYLTTVDDDDGVGVEEAEAATATATTSSLESSELRRSMLLSATSKEAVLANSVIVSFNFRAGVRSLESVLVDGIRPRQTVLRNGVVYTRVGAALDISVALLRAYLSGHATTGEHVAAAAAAAAAASAEQILVESMPLLQNYYAEEDTRRHELDDLAVGGRIMELVRSLAIVKQARELFDSDGDGDVLRCVPPAHMFDEASYYSLQQSKEALHRQTRAPYTLYSAKHGSIRVRAEALERALHATPAAAAAAGIAALKSNGGSTRARENAASERLNRALLNERGGGGGAALVDIEDLVEGARANRALPLCMLNVLESPTYHKHPERLWLSQTLHSFDTPALNTPAIARSLMRLSTPQMIAVHYKELAAYTKTRANLDHERNAAYVATHNTTPLADVSEQQMKEALAKTTCAAGCATHYQYGTLSGVKRCPFAWEDTARLDALLARSGVTSAERRAEIIALPGAPRQCALQLQHSRAPTTRHVPVLRTETADVVIAHPYHYFHLAADHLQRAHETLPAPQ